jgi:hypothetical protein
MKKNPTPPRTNRDAFAALVLGEIDTILDKLEALQGNVNATGEDIKVTINSLRPLAKHTTRPFWPRIYALKMK